MIRQPWDSVDTKKEDDGVGRFWGLLDVLYPTDEEVKATARAEVTPDRHEDFSPIARGFLVNGLIMGFCILLAAISTPWRIIWRQARHRTGHPTR